MNRAIFREGLKQKNMEKENLIEDAERLNFEFNLNKGNPNALNKFTSRKKVLKSIAKLHNKPFITDSARKRGEKTSLFAFSFKPFNSF